MIRFTRGYSGKETNGVKYRRGDAVSLHPWQEAALVGSGRAEYAGEPEAAEPAEKPKKKPRRSKRAGPGALKQQAEEAAGG